jgi:hypothetical protein
VEPNIYKIAVFWIRVDLKTDQDPAFLDLDPDPALDPDLDPGFIMTERKGKLFCQNFFSVSNCFKDID